MSKYYKIPLTERIVGTSSGSLYKLLRENYPELYDREVGRMDLKYGNKDNIVNSNTIADYNRQTSLLYKAMGIPEFIIAVEIVTGGGIEEISTSTPLMVSSKKFLKTRKVSKEDATSYIEEVTDYSEKIANYFTSANKKGLEKKLEQ